MKHPFNYLSLAALPALASLLYFPTGEGDYLCFLGFLVFLRYLWVNPDELFLLSVRKAATGAFLLQFVLIRKVGVRRETIGNLENGRYNPSLKLAMDIAKVFNTTVENIFFFFD